MQRRVDGGGTAGGGPAPESEGASSVAGLGRGASTEEAGGAAWWRSRRRLEVEAGLARRRLAERPVAARRPAQRRREEKPGEGVQLHGGEAKVDGDGVQGGAMAARRRAGEEERRGEEGTALGT
jgi:hypothetical protein